MSPAAIQQRLRVCAGSSRILAILIDAKGSWLQRETIAQRAGLKLACVKVMMVPLRATLGQNAVHTKAENWAGRVSYRVSSEGIAALNAVMAERVSA